MKFPILFSFLVLNIAHAQSTGPVYNFNFYNKDVNVAPGFNGAVISTAGASPVSPAPAPLNSAQVISQNPRSEKYYFEKSLLNPEDKFIGLIGTALIPVSSSHEKRMRSFSLNMMTSSLWGLKYITEEFSDNESDEYYYSDLNLRVQKLGINKFIPLYNNIAIELGAFYEKGKLSEAYEYYPAYIGIYHDISFQGASANIGLNFLSGNFIAGVQIQKRLAFSSKQELFPEHTRLKKQAAINGNIGLYF